MHRPFTVVVVSVGPDVLRLSAYELFLTHEVVCRLGLGKSCVVRSEVDGRTRWEDSERTRVLGRDGSVNRPTSTVP